jgi:hypothetical protein
VVETEVSILHFSATWHQRDIGEERNMLVEEFVTSYFGAAFIAAAAADADDDTNEVCAIRTEWFNTANFERHDSELAVSTSPRTLH